MTDYENSDPDLENADPDNADPDNADLAPAAPPGPDQTPVTTIAQAQDRVAQLVGSAIRRQLWLMLLDRDGVQLPVVIPIEDIPLRPQSGHLTELAARFAELLDSYAPGGSVILTLERPGGADLTAPDQAWASELRTSFGSTLRITALFVASDDGIVELAA